MSAVETIKLNSHGLKGSLPLQLVEPTPQFNEEGKQLLKFHGIYQQTNRDVRGRQNQQFSFMIRSRLPGGKLTAEQYLVHDAIADTFGQGDLRLTTRQAIQLHGIIKSDLRPTLKKLNEALVTTLNACGDVNRNVMACPAPFGDPIRQQLQEYADKIAAHLSPRTTAYHEIWLQDDNGQSVKQTFETEEVVEPIYGKVYLPRKFKIALAFAGDNCTDIFTNDIGLVGLSNEANQTVHGFNVYVGGGLALTHTKEQTLSLLAQPLGYVPAAQMIDVVEKIVLVQRDFGDRTDRRHARMKYLVNDWGIETFRAKVEAYLGYDIAAIQPMPALDADDHLGWHEQLDGHWFYGLFVENGRVKDVGKRQIRSGLRAIISQFKPNVILTGQQNIIMSGFTTAQKAEVNRLMLFYGLQTIDTISNIRRYAMACPALPTCSLAVSEAERVLPRLIDEIEQDMAALGLANERINLRMTGCPNGCARPFVADIGIVGRSGTKYNLSLGGNIEGTRLNTVYKELVEFGDLRGEIYRVLAAYQGHAEPQERLGDWVNRVGVSQVSHLAEQVHYSLELPLQASIPVLV